ncbi:carbon-nitrogen hydrolase family protein [Sulfitobacter mediterraneus]|jgi:predicted amidohydrolase|uniref:carbon-nitrogen hydrolase family protein n=1 Tax=Sulfitobacter TaxID=60136 RepID=UPI0019332027|nr:MULTISPECIES: carbon-nitrogen hydrolase family protein [Sulfitobacter]MBM1633871.1 carbon-nitrogen hydrolase family protein [Sulfitobacter mediterraneus]MBM1641614.1 carbon-nitrogen hydrolase family protein [Sulfitobacter mediterraneus]MBM1645735.1 carbon-nitrogen hydrolase family protein [Sulfitobacter mediterraneus]MBM1649733.1 carbon-nitrogen hydrolase family protein [Sulfitobacter mediterraneus]MBM1653804.1 carbon-nitrogen hydrolase family protein [Sulfitobacter mediterraneus]
MKIASAAYPLDVLTSWAQFEDKIEAWVADAAGAGADLLVFPEYGAMELATLDGLKVAGDLEASLFSVSDRLPDADALHLKLAASYGVHIVAASGPAATATRPVNRARLITPTGQVGVQDKQIMTRFEGEVWDVVPGNNLQVFDTALGKIGILICYDSEFPLLGRALTECDVIAVPSVTETLAGYWRVRIGSMARALENQCVTAMSSVVGDAEWSEALGTSFGAGGIYGPPDNGFPPTGVLAAGALNDPVWTYADVDLKQIANVRADGIVLNRQHWSGQEGRDHPATNVSLR